MARRDLHSNLLSHNATREEIFESQGSFGQGRRSTASYEPNSLLPSVAFTSFVEGASTIFRLCPNLGCYRAHHQRGPDLMRASATTTLRMQRPVALTCSRNQPSSPEQSAVDPGFEPVALPVLRPDQ